CDTFIVDFINQSTGGTSYFWDFGNGITSSAWEETVTYAAGNYNVFLQVNDTRPCSTNDTTYEPLIFTPVVTNPLADFGYDVSTNCDVTEVTLTNLSSGTNRFIWRLNNRVFSNDAAPNSALVYYRADTIAVELAALGATNCSADDTAVKSIVIPAPYGYPVADFDFTPVNPEADEMIQFNNLSQRAAVNSWDFGDGSYSSEIHPRHAYSQKGEYTICLSVENEYSCPDVACKDIPVIYTALVDLPTAFTPNGDDHNDIFIVRGEDIVKMRLRIFNRWGELVFESHDPAIGWDGTYKGKPQEMEVYDWLLNATLKNGQDVFKKGNVTLLR
ncbi:MAG TPA: PKD domain-containing protein, partial [Chitinophagales bacterium]|nr:PKD domain-containing protein [Chitinophagales bacterium]